MKDRTPPNHAAGAARRRAAAVRALAALALALAALGAGAAVAAAPTRAEYVTRLERICKPRALATQRAMKGARGDVSAERLAVAAVKFHKAAGIFGSTTKRIGAVPRPAGDAPVLRRWFAYLKRQEAYLKLITAQLRAGHAVKAQRLTARFIHNGNLSNRVVLEFGFRYCSFKFSRYG